MDPTTWALEQARRDLSARRVNCSTSSTKSGKAGAQFKSLREIRADITTPVDRLRVTIIGGVAEFERGLIRAHRA